MFNKVLEYTSGVDFHNTNICTVMMALNYIQPRIYLPFQVLGSFPIVYDRDYFDNLN